MSGRLEMVIEIGAPGGPDVGETMIVGVPRELISVTAQALFNMGTKRITVNPRNVDIFNNVLLHL